jgi:hypothetical protein
LTTVICIVFSDTVRSISLQLTAMEKKIPKNAKYDHVQPTLDTGESLSKHLARIEYIRASASRHTSICSCSSFFGIVVTRDWGLMKL